MAYIIDHNSVNHDLISTKISAEIHFNNSFSVPNFSMHLCFMADFTGCVKKIEEK